LALLISRQNRSKEVILEEAASLMKKMWHDSRGLEALAIFYALPYALLMWSALTFFGAFAFTCFRYSSPATRFPVGSVLLAVLVLIGWCVGTAWMKEHNTGRRVLSAWVLIFGNPANPRFQELKGKPKPREGKNLCSLPSMLAIHLLATADQKTSISGVCPGYSFANLRQSYLLT